MLGDEEEKKPANSLNPLKKAIRRRNAKTVQFSAPSYVEPSDNDYSSEEEEEDSGLYNGQEQNGAAVQENEQRDDVDNTAAVDPLKARGQMRDGTHNGEELADQSLNNGVQEQTTAAEDVQTSDETLDRSGKSKCSDLSRLSQLTTADDGTASKSRKGTVRNTDSFYKDDGVETRKISLTPSLLRDDSSGGVTKPNEVSSLIVILEFYLMSISLSPESVSTRSRKMLLRKARMTRRRKKREACLEVCSNERIRRARFKTRSLRKRRRPRAISPGSHRSPRNRWSHCLKRRKLLDPHHNHTDRPANFKSLHPQRCHQDHPTTRKMPSAQGQVLQSPRTPPRAHSSQSQVERLLLFRIQLVLRAWSNPSSKL